VSVETDHLLRVARVVSRIHALPAIATEDWCDRAAAAVLGLEPSLTAVVGVGVFGAGGEVQKLEGIGAASEIGEVASSAVRHHSLGWWLPARLNDPTAPRCALLSRTPDHARWARSAAGSAWQRTGVEDLIVALVPLPGSAENRLLVVEMGAPNAGFRDLIIAMLSAVLPELARRAAIAFGSEPTESANRITPREQEVLDLLVLGCTVKQIADIISRSPHTVHDHVKSLHRKLRANSRGELVSRALGHATRGERGMLATTSIADAEEKPARFSLARSA
jgi:DNA-binding CsgD family transcriptional regulator